MGNDHWGLRLHFFSVATIFLVATTSTCSGARNITIMSCFEHERLALLEFKDSVTDDHGVLSSWVGNDCCHWEGVRCDDVTRNVESLQLRGNIYDGRYLYKNCGLYSCSGVVGTSLGELRHLKYLDLSGNGFHGCQIPAVIGSLKQLTYLNLSSASFCGLVPQHIGNLSNLIKLGLRSDTSEPRLMVPDLTWIFRLSTLELLDLSHVNLAEAKHHDMLFYMIPSLKELRLSDCYLSDDDLDSFRNSSITLSNIRDLDLSHNTLSGRCIPFLANMTSLRVLDLSGNQLNSLVPVMPNLLELDLSENKFEHWEDVGIWRRCHLKQLKVSSNWLRMEWTDSSMNISEYSGCALEWLDLSSSFSKGTIPEPLERMTNLRGLLLSDNKLTGSIPESLGRLGSLQVVDLSHNMLTGPVPESLGRLRSLQVVDLSYNKLTVPIPTFLGKLTKLDLSGNHLNGSIPETFGRLEALTQLILNSNQLTGPIPASLGRLSLLQTLHMSSNFLTGTIPDSIGQLANLHYLDVSDNSLEGVVFETHFANLSKLEYFYASNNSKLTFNFSREYWVPPSQLKAIDLSFCKIVSGFPQLVRNQTNLESLLLSNAAISGPLPKWLRNIPTMKFLDLSYNNLSGSLTNLPSGKGWIHEGSALFLQNNFFSETIPRSLCEMEGLYLLNISKNKLTGKIPICLMNSQYLLYLVLSSNRLSGIIPSYTGAGRSTLQMLALNDNNLSGELPQEFWNLTELRILDLGDNALWGKIPEWVGEQVELLLVFRLHKNKFTGGIPRSLCMISDLHMLDFSHNNLTGTIPRCLRKLNSMANRSFPLTTSIFWFPLEGMIQVMKGFAMEYTKTLKFVLNMDFSSNKLVGKIPTELTALRELVGLNLSNNHLSGGIPDNIGDMKALVSLDFSGNKLSGLIPPSIASLTSLSQLNLSNNNLSGRIPTRSQLQTFNDPSIYAGNKDLCGSPLPKNCSNREDNPTATPKNHFDKLTKVWFYLDIACGFATGFWGLIMVLAFKKEWRHMLFMFVEDTINKIYVAVMIRVNKMKRERSHIASLVCK